jgi:hypothetical protein
LGVRPFLEAGRGVWVRGQDSRSGSKKPADFRFAFPSAAATDALTKRKTVAVTTQSARVLIFFPWVPTSIIAIGAARSLGQRHHFAAFHRRHPEPSFTTRWF